MTHRQTHYHHFIVTGFIILLLFFGACRNEGEGQVKTDDSVQAGKDSAEKAKAYFPVMDYLKSEIRYVDSLPVGIKKYVTIGNHTDSSYIKLDEFHEYANAFLATELEPLAFTTNYKESSFYDRSTKASTFLYQANTDVPPIKRIDIQSRPDATYDKVFNIYMERMQQVGDTLVIKKMTWKPGRQLEVIESRTTHPETTETSKIKQVKIVWDNWEKE